MITIAAIWGQIGKRHSAKPRLFYYYTASVRLCQVWNRELDPQLQQVASDRAPWGGLWRLRVRFGTQIKQKATYPGISGFVLAP